MRRKRSYPAAFRQQMVNLVRSGRSANDLAKEFEPTAQPTNLAKASKAE